MPTKRTLRARGRRRDVPTWARALVEEGREPDRNSPEWDAYLGWRFFGDSVPGLPDEGDRKAAEILKRAGVMKR